MVEYLKVENRLLRDRLPKRLRVTVQERRRLVKLRRPLGSAIRHLVTIVTPRTFARWLNGERQGARAKRQRKPGRPRPPDEIRDWVVRMARETGWGYSRILGELKKLGIQSIARSTVKNILKEHDLDPGPKRGEGTWTDFLKRDAPTLCASDPKCARKRFCPGRSATAQARSWAKAPNSRRPEGERGLPTELLQKMARAPFRCGRSRAEP
jgi:putative transposase